MPVRTFIIEILCAAQITRV